MQPNYTRHLPPMTSIKPIPCTCDTVKARGGSRLGATPS